MSRRDLDPVFACTPWLFDTGGAPQAIVGSAGNPQRTQQPEIPLCPQQSPRVETEDSMALLGQLTVDEYVSIVRDRWRARRGRGNYARERQAPLIRALVVHALKPECPDVAERLEHELTLEVGRLRAEGLNRAHVQRELYYLSRGASEVLLEAKLPPTLAAEMIDTIDHRLLALIEWHSPACPRARTNGRQPELVA